ncbi:MAG: Uma2 family endonuclease [Thiolinea sp.]
MAAPKLKTVDDLLQSADERVELINGEIHKRPMARADHALIQSSLSDEVSVLKRRGSDVGWWIMTEVSVRYGEHNCPTHDLAGWRKERMPERPTGMMTLLPDWVCEITSPGHERKDMFANFILLQRYQVPFYWVISPEDQTLIAYALNDGAYQVVYSVECRREPGLSTVFIRPFLDCGIDLAYVFGSSDICQSSEQLR